MVPNECTIGSPIESFSYEALTWLIPGTRRASSCKIPDESSRVRLTLALATNADSAALGTAAS